MAPSWRPPHQLPFAVEVTQPHVQVIAVGRAVGERDRLRAERDRPDLARRGTAKTDRRDDRLVVDGEPAAGSIDDLVSQEELRLISERYKEIAGFSLGATGRG